MGIGSFLKSLVPDALGFFKEKQKLKQEVKLEVLRGKAEYERQKSVRAENSEGRDHEWELLSIKNSGWKDEWVLILLSIPMVGSFIPAMTPYVVDGFEALDATPDWYRWLVMLIFTAIYGIRIWRRK